MKSRGIKWLALLLLIGIVFPATAWAQDVELPVEKENAAALVNDNALVEEPAPEDGSTTETTALNTSMTKSEFEQKLEQFKKNTGLYDGAVKGNYPLGEQCQGYGRYIAASIFGTDPYGSGWSITNATANTSYVDQIQTGDFVRFRNGSTWDHTIFITNIIGDQLIYTDCNGDNKNTVRWNKTISKSILAGKLVQPLYFNSGFGYFSHYNANPVSTVPIEPTPSTINRIGTLSNNGVFFVKEGALDAPWVEENVGVMQGVLSGNRIGVVKNDGVFYAKEGGLDANWVEINVGVKQAVMSGNRIGILKNNGVFYVKEGSLDADWHEISVGVKQVLMDGNRIGVLRNDGVFYVKEGGLETPWVEINVGVKQGTLSGNRIGVLKNDGVFYVKEGGLEAQWIEINVGAKQGILSGNRIGVLKNDGVFYVKEGGLDAGWVETNVGVKHGVLSNNQIGVLRNDGVFYVKEGGLDAAWIEESVGVKQGVLLDSDSSFILDDEKTTQPDDTETLILKKFSTDKLSNQKFGTHIGLTARVDGGTAPYQYKFYAKIGNTTMLIQDYTSGASATFTPNQAGSYTLFVDVKDSKGNTTTGSIDNFVIYEEKAEEPDNGHDDPVISKVSCSYQTHVQNEGWQDWKTDGDTSGTSGKSLRLEGIKIKLNTNPSELGLSYATHVENIGWQDPVSTGEMSGTTGKGLRLEAIQLELTGADASKFDVYYQVHAENFGWLDWAKNGDSAGTAGFGYRLEAIRIVVVPKGGAAPGAMERSFVSQN